MSLSFSSLFLDDIILFFPEIFFSLGIMILLLFGVLRAVPYDFLKKKINPFFHFYHNSYPILGRNICFFSLFLIFLTALLVLKSFDCGEKACFADIFVHDDISRTLTLIILTSSFASLAISQFYIEDSQINNFEYFFLILFSTFGLIILVCSIDFISVYLSIELQSLSFYVLASFCRRSIFSTEAGLKYFILGSLSSGFLLFAISLIYALTGSTNMLTLKFFSILSSFENLDSLKVTLIFLTAAFLFKLAAFPFHMWSPDVYEGSPTSTTVFFVFVPKIALLSIFVRLYTYSFPEVSNLWNDMLLFSAVGSIFYGSFVAIQQNALKRLLAYSSIGHVGFLLLPLATMVSGIDSLNAIEDVRTTFFYLLVYLINSIPVWIILLSSLGGATNSQNSLNLLAALPASSPLLAILAILSFFSMAGIPPLVGFYSKFIVFLTLLKKSFFFTAIFVLVLSVISTYYYLNIVKTISFEKRKHFLFYPPLCKKKSILLAVCSILMVFLFFDSVPLLELSEELARLIF